jgi:hypothetical protein
MTEKGAKAVGPVGIGPSAQFEAAIRSDAVAKTGDIAPCNRAILMEQTSSCRTTLIMPASRSAPSFSLSSPRTSCLQRVRTSPSFFSLLRRGRQTHAGGRPPPRLNVVPIIDRHVPKRVRRIRRGVLDGLSHAEIAARCLAEPGEAALVIRLEDGHRSNCRGAGCATAPNRR